MFQSAPVITDGRTMTSQGEEHSMAVFQSAPVITDGRTISHLPNSDGPNRFNPRPSSLTGEPGGSGEDARRRPVSIRARHH